MAQDFAGQGYDAGRRVARRVGIADSPTAKLLLGAAIGFAIGYALWGAMGRRQHARSNDDVIDTLNLLIETSKDGEQGFRTSAEAVKRADLNELFNRAADRCAQGAAELQRAVRRLGGDPELGGSVGGALHRRWVDLKSLMTGMDDAAILNEVERGEDVAKAAYRDALDTGLPPQVRRIVQRQYQGVRQHHDRVRDLRNAAR